MLRRKTMGLAVAAALLICLGLYFLRREQEPRFKGRNRSYWLDRFDHDSAFADGRGRPLPAWEEDVEALRAIGTNALPPLIRQLEKPDSPLKTDLLRRLRGWYGPIAVANRRAINFVKTDFDKKRDALKVLAVLKEQAVPAVPRLIKMLNGPDEQAAYLAAETIGEIGPPAKAALPTLMEKLKQRKAFAFQAIVGLGPEGRTAASALIPFLRDPDPTFRTGAALALAVIGPSPEALPELIAILSDTNESVRINALSAILRSGVRNESVIRGVSVLTNDAVLDVRRHAEGVLKKILSLP